MGVFLLQDIDLTEDYDTRLRKALGYKAMPSSNQSVRKSRPLHSEDGLVRIGSSEVSLDEIVLRKKIQEEITSLVEEHSNRSYLKQYNLPITNKILFFGPSGCGKTFLATALSRALRKPLFIINLARIVDSGLGQTSTNISRAIEEASSIGAIIFFDEFDSLGKERVDSNDHGEMRRVTSSLLQMMDHIDDDTVMIAATNHKELIDHAILRRFSKQIEFFLPTKNELQQYIDMLAKKAGLEVDTQTRNNLAERFMGDSFATAKDRFLSSLKKYLLTKKESRVKVIQKEILKYAS